MESNPYAPPIADTLEAEQRDFPWFVAARGIYVQDGARLPRIDLTSGEEHCDLLPVPHKVNLSNGKATQLFSIILFAVVAIIIAIDLPYTLTVISATVATYLISFLVRKSYPQVNFTYFRIMRSKSAAGGYATLQVMRILLYIATIGSLALLYISGWLWIGFPALCLLSHLLSKRKEKITLCGLEIREAGGTTGWVRIGGAHPAAIAKLGKIQKLRDPRELVAQNPASLFLQEGKQP